MDPDDPWLLSREALRPLDRLLLALGAALPLTAVWDLAIRPGPTPLSPWGLLVLPILLGALAIPAALGATAILAPVRELRVDPARHLVIDSGGARWLGLRERQYPFDAIEEVALRRDYDTDGPDRLLLVLVVRGRRRPVTLLSRPLEGRPELESLADRLRAAL